MKYINTLVCKFLMNFSNNTKKFVLYFQKTMKLNLTQNFKIMTTLKNYLFKHIQIINLNYLYILKNIGLI